ncbi:glycosyl transferase family 41-domain-containing protein [Cunninghamella echinulata]|nr:glycosyl transferase family 41-domain-containing protein [Cunninghamella echinulata]
MPTTPSMSVLLPLYYLSLALNPNPSTINNLGILLTNISGVSNTVQLNINTNTSATNTNATTTTNTHSSGIMLAMQYYMYGLQLDHKHSHLYTNLGSLLKDMGHLQEAVRMYEKAIEINPQFDVALANLGNTLKDMGKVQDSIQWYQRAVQINPSFIDAICGLVNSLMAVCDWRGRGIVYDNDQHQLQSTSSSPTAIYFNNNSNNNNNNNEFGTGWMGQIVSIVEKHLNEGAQWGIGILNTSVQQEPLSNHLISILATISSSDHHISILKNRLYKWVLLKNDNKRKKKNEGGCIVVNEQLAKKYKRPSIPDQLATPPIPAVLPFHAFTYPLSARQIRLISHRNALRISHTTLTSSWISPYVYPPPPPPCPRIKVGYVSSDFNNHPLSHLMQSVFGFHNRHLFDIFCYALTPSDQSNYRLKIENDAEHFLDVSQWTNQQIVEQIQKDHIHILVNLNGYTKGGRNEIFAARPCPVQCSFMGFASTLGGGWCDWIIADPIVCPPTMVSCEVWRKRNLQQQQKIKNDDGNDILSDFDGDIDPEELSNDFVYTEKFIYMPHSYFVNDHKQGFQDEDEGDDKNSVDDEELLWINEKEKRKKMRHELFPNISDTTVIFANFNQLYKLEPNTFHMWLSILKRVPDSLLWLLKFPPAGEEHLKRAVSKWASTPQQANNIINRIVFTDVAPKKVHIQRGRVVDIFLDTPECNAHTTAADILWSGTPVVTFPKHQHKMCSRVGASIAYATGFGHEMVVYSEKEYEDQAVQWAQSLSPSPNPIIHEEKEKITVSLSTNGQTIKKGYLMDLRKRLFLSRTKNPLFDTKRWTRNLEKGYQEAWKRWISGEEMEDITSNPITASGCIWINDPDEQTHL